MRSGTISHLVFALFALFTLGAGLPSPAMAIAHGVAHQHLTVDHHRADPAAQESSAVLSPQSANHRADHRADHPALRSRERPTRSLNTVLLVSVVEVTLPTTPKARTAVVVTASATEPPPSQLTPTDQPRPPPRG